MKIAGLILTTLFLAIGITSCQRGGRGERQEQLRFATGGTAGVYFAYGTAIAKTLSEIIGIEIVVKSTGGSRANIQHIHAGEADLAFAQSDVLYYAWRGRDLFDGEQIRTFNIIGGLYTEVCQIVAVADINSISELRGKRVSVGDAGSGVEFNSRQILAAYGISFSDIILFNMGFAPSMDALREGRIDAAFVVSGAPTPAIVNLADTHDITIIPIVGESAQALMRDFPFYTEYTIPAGTYRGVGAVQTVGVRATLIASTIVPDETVYRLTRALFENRAQIAAAHPRGAELDPATAIEGMTLPFHPGAIQFYRSVGVLR